MPSSVLNSDDGVISGTSGIKAVGGDDGVLVFQSKGTETARINTDKQIVAAAGTASLPIYSTTGDLNTGIYFPAADNIGFATGGTIRGRWTTDGLCFGTDTAAANALDDYEEGTFTPTATGGATAGTTTYTNQVGGYTKIGRQVTVTIYIRWTAATGSGGLRIGGLPFTSVSVLLWTGSCFTDGLNWSGGTYQTLYMGGSSAAISLYGASDDGTEVEQAITNETASIYGTLTYFAV